MKKCIAREAIPVLDFWLELGENLHKEAVSEPLRQVLFSNSVKLRRLQRIIRKEIETGD